MDPSIIPINDYINIINKENTIIKDYYQINKENLYRIYKWNLTTNDFFPIPEFKRLSELINEKK
ncbi:hypothetical protein [Mycoplasmopsis felis]|uniref:hypothetical protein n=1 Tax=Mycoplasmopsis felis TaxID=33923 RepID=UPI002AFE6D69|nr:hypothetical protein [Mycoplasmopsis felis]WQQ03136.1 hypothetical protein RRG38_03230 [Mycoplasmopsis felis]